MGMARTTLTDWWTRRMWRWIDVARKDVRRGEGRRYKAPTALQATTARYNQLKAKKRDLLTFDYRRRDPR
jgi:hypothetical protein